MAAANPQPLQSRPYNDHAPPPIQIDDDGPFEDGDTMDDLEDNSAPVNVAERHVGGGVVMTSRTGELTLSFEGEVYVFPAVTPEKVKAVLLLLGGRDVPTRVPTIDRQCHQHNRGISDSPKPSSLSRRIASLVRFREKRKERCFDKKIRYTVRKEVAQRMHRRNGQFASLKESSGGSSWDSPQGCPQDGTSSLETVTLCNACGLMWANKGTLRDLSKGGRNLPLDQIEPGTPTDVKPSIMEGEISGHQDEQGTSEDPSKVVSEVIIQTNCVPLTRLHLPVKILNPRTLKISLFPNN
ncbi:hypothetical protein K2173_028489 [Erythroxylum novogranatense]|uniref:Uncharacterized protein n=1 Tax=Erythroxylum novogranatense TaxID=1862640 RepID=A0AAV8U1Z0_9ROSI|nr:hypothetical protein K2173_028489 [Erythroxylum novogranatense]